MKPSIDEQLEADANTLIKAIRHRAQRMSVAGQTFSDATLQRLINDRKVGDEVIAVVATVETFGKLSVDIRQVVQTYLTGRTGHAVAVLPSPLPEDAMGIKVAEVPIPPPAPEPTKKVQGPIVEAVVPASLAYQALRKLFPAWGLPENARVDYDVEPALHYLRNFESQADVRVEDYPPQWPVVAAVDPYADTAFFHIEDLVGPKPALVGHLQGIGQAVGEFVDSGERDPQQLAFKVSCHALLTFASVRKFYAGSFDAFRQTLAAELAKQLGNPVGLVDVDEGIRMAQVFI